MRRSWNSAACGRRIGMCGYTSVSEDGRTCWLLFVFLWNPSTALWTILLNDSFADTGGSMTPTSREVEILGSSDTKEKKNNNRSKLTERKRTHEQCGTIVWDLGFYLLRSSKAIAYRRTWAPSKDRLFATLPIVFILLPLTLASAPHSTIRPRPKTDLLSDLEI